MFKCNFKAYEGSEKYIFISYAHKDSDTVYPIIERLNEAGYRIWYDDGITPGSEWPENIALHLISCETFIFFASPNSVASDNCKREVNFALSKNKNFFTISLVPTEFSLGLELQISTQQNILMYEYDDMEKFYDTIFAASSLDSCIRSEDEESESKAVSKADVKEVSQIQPVQTGEQKNVTQQNTVNPGKNKIKPLILGLGCLVALVIGILFLVSALSSDEIVLDSGQIISKDSSFLSFYEGAVITAGDIKKLNKLNDVLCLNFENCSVDSGADLSSLDFLPEVESLVINSADIPDYSFLSRMKSLNDLVITDTTFTEGISLLPQDSIRGIYLKNVGSIDINSLSEMKLLDELYIYDSDVAEITEPLPKSIYYLAFSNCNLKNTEFLNKSHFEILMSIDLSKNEISDVSFLSNYADSVSYIDLSDTKIDDNSLKAVQCCSGVVKLRLNNVPLNDLSVISAMNYLNEFEAFGCGLSSLDNADFSTKKISRLVLSGNRLTSIDELSLMKYDDIYTLSVLDISDNNITSIASLPKTEYGMLSIYGNDIDFSVDENNAVLKDISSGYLFSNYFEGIENANIQYLLVLVDGNVDDQADIISKGCSFSCQQASSAYVRDKMISSDYDISKMLYEY